MKTKRPRSRENIIVICLMAALNVLVVQVLWLVSSPGVQKASTDEDRSYEDPTRPSRFLEASRASRVSGKHTFHTSDVQRALPPDDGKKVFSNLFLHIPKTGSTFAQAKLQRMLEETPEYIEWTLKHSEIAYTACNEVVRPIDEFEANYSHHVVVADHQGKKKRRTCTMWMSEVAYPSSKDQKESYAVDRPQNYYVIVREPRTHVLSQYFHCAESSMRRSAMQETSLTKWLQAWNHAQTESHAVRRDTRTRLPCYVPINMQSARVGYDRIRGDGKRRQDWLRHNYVVVGDSSQMSLSLCAIFIEWTGMVPPHCDCSNSPAASDDAVGSASWERYNTSRYSHGVKHHGNTYKTSPLQDSLIANLTKLDEKLVNDARILLGEKVRALEMKFGTKLCQKLKEV